MELKLSATAWFLAVGLLFNTAPHDAQAQQAASNSRTVDISVPAGGSRVTQSGVIRGDGDMTYLLRLRAGEAFSVQMKTSNSSSYFNVTAPNAKAALHIGSSAGNEMTANAEVDGAYKIVVYLMRNAARRNEQARFALNIDLPGRPGAQAGGDFADGLAGGPDFWRVESVGRVNVRSGPGSRAAIAARLSAGQTVRNRGCRMSDQVRWCQIESLDGATKGWVAGRFLREGADPTQDARPGDARVKGTNYHATGLIPCALKSAPGVKECDFGVTRGAQGVGTVFITSAGKTVRVLSFDNGKVASQSAASSVDLIRDGDISRVSVNGDEEIYTIPDAVINGG